MKDKDFLQVMESLAQGWIPEDEIEEEDSELESELQKEFESGKE